MWHGCIGVRESKKAEVTRSRVTLYTSKCSRSKPDKYQHVYEEEDWQVPHLRRDCGELKQRRYQYWGGSDPCQRSTRPFPQHSVTLLAHQSRESKPLRPRASGHQWLQTGTRIGLWISHGSTGLDFTSGNDSQTRKRSGKHRGGPPSVKQPSTTAVTLALALFQPSGPHQCRYWYWDEVKLLKPTSSCPHWHWHWHWH